MFFLPISKGGVQYGRALTKGCVQTIISQRDIISNHGL